jgi:hypothetical protein
MAAMWMVLMVKAFALKVLVPEAGLPAWVKVKYPVWRVVRNRPRLGAMPWLTATLAVVTPAVATLVAWAVQAYLVEANPVQTPAALMALREAIRAMTCSVPVAM